MWAEGEASEVRMICPLVSRHYGARRLKRRERLRERERLEL